MFDLEVRYFKYLKYISSRKHTVEYEHGMSSIIRGVRRIAQRKKGFKMSVEAILMHFECLFFFLKPTNDKI